MFTHSGLPQVGHRLLEDLEDLPDDFAFFSCAEYAFATDFPGLFVESSFFFRLLTVVVVIVCVADITDSYSATCHYIDRH